MGSQPWEKALGVPKKSPRASVKPPARNLSDLPNGNLRMDSPVVACVIGFKFIDTASFDVKIETKAEREFRNVAFILPVAPTPVNGKSDCIRRS
jgi:hypothetical protein